MNIKTAVQNSWEKIKERGPWTGFFNLLGRILAALLHPCLYGRFASLVEILFIKRNQNRVCPQVMLTYDKRTARIVSSCQHFLHQGSVSCFSNLNSDGDFFMFQCSVSCGEGIRQRSVSCRLASGQLSPGCSGENKPAFREACNIRPCPTWITGDWGKVMCHLIA